MIGELTDVLIRDVSDTARWVSAYRAAETSRNDALAAKFAGERGPAIAARGPRQMRSGWPIVTRTFLVDDLVSACVADGCDRVLNLAAGFDTRPYRMSLPGALEWIEADLAPIIDETERLLEHETPRCRLRRESVDLSDSQARDTFLNDALRGARRALVLTEGLVAYLDDEAVRGLSRAFLAQAPVRWWILDMNGPAIREMIMDGMGSLLANAPMKFAPPEGITFFERVGWKTLEVRSIVREAARLRRLPFLFRLFARLSNPNPRGPGRALWSAVVRFESPAGSAPVGEHHAVGS
jgi:methyltransferase (TIGR00027 family)